MPANITSIAVREGEARAPTFTGTKTTSLFRDFVYVTLTHHLMLKAF